MVKKEIEMSAHKLSGRIVYYLYATINRISGKTIEINRSILHRRYEVNRYDLEVTSEDKICLTINHKELISSLKNDGWKKSNDSLKAYQKEINGHTARITVSDVQSSWYGMKMEPKYRLSVHVVKGGLDEY